MCELCAIEKARFPDKTLGVDYDLAFNRSHDGKTRRMNTPNNGYFDEMRYFMDDR
jgi:hypothetical protein